MVGSGGRGGGGGACFVLLCQQKEDQLKPVPWHTSSTPDQLPSVPHVHVTSPDIRTKPGLQSNSHWEPETSSQSPMNPSVGACGRGQVTHGHQRHKSKERRVMWTINVLILLQRRRYEWQHSKEFEQHMVATLSAIVHIHYHKEKAIV